MLRRLKQEWQAFRRGRPGNRFEQRYERSKKTRSSQQVLFRFLKLAIALILFAAGVVLCFIPGPGLPLIVLGAGLLGDESRRVARALDWMEVRGRKLFAWGRRWWNRAPLAARSAVIVLAALVAGGAAYGSFRFLQSH